MDEYTDPKALRRAIEARESMRATQEDIAQYQREQQAKTPPPAIEKANHREALLREAMGIVLKDRNSVYGAPEDNFRTIANLWNAYLQGRPGAREPKLTMMDVVVFNMLQKIARLANSPSHHDSLVDVAGYAACGADIQESMAKTYMQEQAKVPK